MMLKFILFVLSLFISPMLCAKAIDAKADIHERIEIVMWHALAGDLAEKVEQLVQGFNESQTDYQVKAIYKGEYKDTLTSFVAAFRAKQAPAIVQVPEVSTASMLVPEGIIKPLFQLMQEQHMTLPLDDFLPAVKNQYSQAGQLQAMPFNVSVPVIFYDAAALATVGVNEATFPKTWDEIEKLLVHLREAGFSCSYTTAYPSWVLIESYLALHALPLVNLDDDKAVYNHKALVQHLERLKRWKDADYFFYGGRSSDATALFTSGYCKMLSQSSGAYQSLAKLVKFKLGVAMIPFDPKLGVRHANVIGGAALWAVSGHSAEIYRGVAKFYAYLAEPKTQQRWHEMTGYIPLGFTGVYAQLKQIPVTSAILAIAKSDLSQSIQERFCFSGVPQSQIRMINDETIELVFAGIKRPQQAIDEAVSRANFILHRFRQNMKIVNRP
jgi:sn-glycerol 3-phosphate transport system substrate-binding protein